MLMEKRTNEARKACQALQDKKATVKTVIHNRHARLVAMADKFRDELLDSLDAATEKTEIDLTKSVSIMENNLRELRKLYNRVDQALSNEENYAEQVTVVDDHGLTTATVSLWVHLILSSNLSRKFRTLLQDLFSWHLSSPRNTSRGKNCTGFPFQNVLSIKSLVCVSVL